jgi:hypothetical protein
VREREREREREKGKRERKKFFFDTQNFFLFFFFVFFFVDQKRTQAQKMNNADLDGDVDVFDDGSSAVAGQAHLEKAREFVTRYDSQLRTLEYALTDALTAPWDPECTTDRPRR